MDDFEKAVLISFDESGAIDPVLKSQAVSFCQQLKQNASVTRLCLERLASSRYVQVQFWCLQTVQDSLRVLYPSIDTYEKSYIRNSIFSLACYDGLGINSLKVLDGPAFLKNKLAQVLVTLVYFDYPLSWSSVFLDFLANLTRGPIVIDMFCRVLVALDEELISLDYPRNADEITIATRVKDSMREQCIPQIVRAWFDVLNAYKTSDSMLATSLLDTIRRYVTWIDIGLIANGAFIPLFFELISGSNYPAQLRGAAASCILAVVSKRMEATSKLTLLQSLPISEALTLLTCVHDSEFALRLGAVITGYAAETLECFKRVDARDLKGLALELLDKALPSVFYILEKYEVDESFNIVQFLSCYVSTMKNLSPLKEKQIAYMGQILSLIHLQIMYDSSYRENLDVFDKFGQEEEFQMTDYRKDLFVLLRSVRRAAPEATLHFVRNLLVDSLSSSEKNVEEVEATLSIFYALGESLGEEGMKDDNVALKELIQMLLSAKFSCHAHRLIALVYLEILARYVKVLQENSEHIPLLLAAFLDGRGIHHPNYNVSRRASYLLAKVVKLMKSKLLPFIDTVLQSLQDTVACLTSSNGNAVRFSSFEDGSHTFEIIGMLIGSEDVSSEKQLEYLSSLITPLHKQVELLLLNAKTSSSEDYSAEVVNLQQIIVAVNALSKGFNERLVTSTRPAVGVLFKQTLDALLEIPSAFPKIEPLRSKVISFLHRMVDILGAQVFPYLHKVLEQLLEGSEPKEMANFFLLLNQLIYKFNTSVHNIVEEIFPVIASRIFCILPSNAFPSGPGSNTECAYMCLCLCHHPRRYVNCKSFKEYYIHFFML